MNLILLYKSQNKDFIINDLYNQYYTLQEEVTKIKNDYKRINKKLNKTIYEINKIKEEKSNNNFDINRNSISSNQSIKSKKLFDVDPISLNTVYNLINDSYNIDYLDNTFTLYTSKNGCLYLVYASEY